MSYIEENPDKPRVSIVLLRTESLGVAEGQQIIGALDCRLGADYSIDREV